MESNLQQLSAFQIYSTGARNKVNVMVDRLWIKDNRVYFRVVEGLPLNERMFKNENTHDIYSIKKEYLLSIRCRLYF